jgi:hypothetical protein
MAKHGLKELFGRPDEQDATGRLLRAKRLRAALEELGPTFSKPGQVLSTRPDLLPPDYIFDRRGTSAHRAAFAPPPFQNSRNEQAEPSPRRFAAFDEAAMQFLCGQVSL